MKRIKLINILRKIAKEYDVKVQFKKDIKYNGLGMAYCPENLMTIRNAKDTDDQTIKTAFFHELGHMIDYKSGHFFPYNGRTGNYAYYKRWGLKAEQSADLIGKKLCKKYFPDLKWKETYFSENDRIWLMDWIDSFFI